MRLSILGKDLAGVLDLDVSLDQRATTWSTHRAQFDQQRVSEAGEESEADGQGAHVSLEGAMVSLASTTRGSLLPCALLCDGASVAERRACGY